MKIIHIATFEYTENSRIVAEYIRSWSIRKKLERVRRTISTKPSSLVLSYDAMNDRRTMKNWHIVNGGPRVSKQNIEDMHLLFENKSSLSTRQDKPLSAH